MVSISFYIFAKYVFFCFVFLSFFNFPITSLHDVQMVQEGHPSVHILNNFIQF